MATTMNDKFLQMLLWNACIERTNDDGSVTLMVESHCTKYEVKVRFHDATDKPTVLSITVLDDRLAKPLVMTE
jgi:hypothetical protein